MVLKRPEICRLIGFNSWTAVQVWVASVVGPAHSQLVEGYLKPYEEMGKKTPKGNDNIKNYLVERALLLEAQVEKRVAELAAGIENNPSKIGWSMLEHYQHFIIEATAMDRLCERERGPNKHHIANKAWSRHPTTLYTHMYELTDALCHNWWKPAETEMWDSDDSDVPFSHPDDVPC